LCPNCEKEERLNDILDYSNFEEEEEEEEENED
jgi:hypothetical protein